MHRHYLILYFVIVKFNYVIQLSNLYLLSFAPDLN